MGSHQIVSYQRASQAYTKCKSVLKIILLQIKLSYKEIVVINIILSTENSMEYNYNKLSNLQTRINRLNHLKEVAFWDQATNMSEKGLDARSEAIAELSQIVHE